MRLLSVVCSLPTRPTKYVVPKKMWHIFQVELSMNKRSVISCIDPVLYCKMDMATVNVSIFLFYNFHQHSIDRLKGI